MFVSTGKDQINQTKSCMESNSGGIAIMRKTYSYLAMPPIYMHAHIAIS